MLTYILRRLASGVLALFVVSALAFGLLSLSSEDVARKILGEAATPSQITRLNAQLGLDQPVVVQFGHWFIKALHGDFGVSWFTGQPVTSTVAGRLPVSLSLILVTILVTIVLAITIGLVAAVRRGWVDRVLQVVSVAGAAVPQFVVGILLTTWFAVSLRVFPATGYTALTADPVAWARTITLPVAALAFHSIASATQQFRSALIRELEKDHVRTLRSRGLFRRDVLLRHVLRGAAPAGLTIISLQLINLLGSTVVIEQIFALPGMGFLAVTATQQGDMPVLMGVIVVTVVIVVIVNLVLDLVIGWLNPKARLS